MMIWEIWCRKPNRIQNSQGKDPRTFEENRQGRDPCTLERNSQGKDPKTLVENSKVGTPVPTNMNSQRKDPRTPDVPFKMWRGQKKRKEKKWKRKKRKKKKYVKHRRHLWWTKRKEQFASFLVSERKEEDLKKQGRERNKSLRTKQFL